VLWDSVRQTRRFFNFNKGRVYLLSPLLSSFSLSSGISTVYSCFIIGEPLSVTLEATVTVAAFLDVPSRAGRVLAGRELWLWPV
jgi:hypothetical protein